MSAFGGYSLLSKQGASTKRKGARTTNVRSDPEDDFSRLAAPQRGALRKEVLNQGKE